MPLQFTQARIVASGDPIKAGDLASLAQAVNSRRWSGIGDWNWRLAFYLHGGLFKKPRNDLGSLATPESEFWNFYQGLEPEDAEWPTAGPGEPEGANLANHLNAMILGSEALNLSSERLRLQGVPAELPVRDPADPLVAADIWELGKAQRGAFDPATGDYGSPMFSLGISYAYIRGSTVSMHGLSYGGYFPTPDLGPQCDGIPDGSGGEFFPPNRLIFFTNLATLEVVTYPGTCPEEPTHVAWVAYTPFAYIVFNNDGSVDYYAKAEWIEGPYTNNATLTKANANAISRAVSEYVAGFKGSAEQRQRADGGMGAAFRTQEFLASQYALAPQIGWNTGDSVSAIYPRFEVTGATSVNVTAGPLACNLGGQEFNFPSGTVATHLLAVARGVATESLSLQILDGEELVESVTLRRNADGNAAEIIPLAPARRFERLRVVVLSEFAFAGSAGSLAVETTCLLEYKPQLYDLYAVIRRSSYRGGLDLDGRGVDEDRAREIYSNYARYGAVVPITETAAGLDGVLNQNAIFDAARQLSKCVRMIPRHNFVGYAVEDGKSVLWLKRWALGMSHNVPIDLLAGIAPAATQPDTLTRGREYEVVTGTIQHANQLWTAGQTFTATGPRYEGTGTLREANGIYAAPPGGFSNGWCVDFTFRPYYWSNSSIWKPESYADILNVLGDRCTLDEISIASDNSTLLHVGYGQRPLYTSETPSGYRYLPTPFSMWNDYSNYGATSEFMKSCRVYEPPVRVESAVVDDDWSASFGEQVIKLTTTGRVHHHDTLAPTAISGDLTTWDLGDLATEVASYRTTENALREYLLQVQTGRRADNAGAGDAAFTSGLPTSGDVFGTVFPTLLFTKDIPEPYLDGNTTLQPANDSPLLSEHLRLVELYVRAGCEGFVDGRESARQACDNLTTTLFDYTFENLMFDADSNRHVPLLPVDVRPDNPQGHGPLPMVQTYAATFNSLCRAVNRLRTARLMLPMTLESRTTTYVESRDVTSEVRNATGARAVADGWSKVAGVDFSIWIRTGTDREGTPSVGAWTPGTTAGVATSIDLSSDGTTATVTTTRQTLDWRWAPDGGFEDALPPDLADLVDLGNAGVIVQSQVVQTVHRYTLGGSETAGTTCNNTAAGTVHVWSLGAGSGNAVLWESDVTTGTQTCSEMTTVSSEVIGESDIYISDSAGDSDPACAGGATRGTNLTAIVTDTPAVTVPTVPYSDGD